MCSICRVSRQWCVSKRLGFLTFAQLLMHAIAHEGCTNNEKESALKADTGRKAPGNRTNVSIVSDFSVYPLRYAPAYLTPRSTSMCSVKRGSVRHVCNGDYNGDFPFWDQNLRMKSSRLSLISSSCYSVSLLYFTRTRNYSEYI